MIDHALRRALDAETHARPSVTVSTPTTIFHVALLGAPSPQAELEALSAAADSEVLHRTDRQVVLKLRTGRLKWERHSEFVTWTLFASEPSSDFAMPEWWSTLGGECIAALEIRVTASSTDEFPFEQARARVSGGLALIQSDFRIREDGRTHITIISDGADPARLGRAIRRLIELETYRTMALLALPVAQDGLRTLDRLEEDLRAVSSTLPTSADNESDARLLTDLTAIAARLERLRCDVSFRLGAADAYAALFAQRVGELREERVEGYECLSVFLNRRFAPAMATCAALSRRLEAAGLRIDRVSALLRTRVDVAVERQNSALLKSMDERAAAQLQLQQTVEGLSVFAIAYYLTGLLERPMEALAPFWPWLHAPLAPALVATAAVASVWLGLRRLKKNHAAPHR